MRAGLVRSHRRASRTVESVLKSKRCDPDLGGRETLENLLSVVGAVVIADAGVVAPDDEMGASVVAPDYGVQHRLARPAVAHMCRHHREHRPPFRIIKVQHYLVGLHPHGGRNIVALGLANQWME